MLTAAAVRALMRARQVRPHQADHVGQDSRLPAASSAKTSPRSSTADVDVRVTADSERRSPTITPTSPHVSPRRSRPTTSPDPGRAPAATTCTRPPVTPTCDHSDRQVGRGIPRSQTAAASPPRRSRPAEPRTAPRTAACEQAGSDRRPPTAKTNPSSACTPALSSAVRGPRWRSNYAAAQVYPRVGFESVRTGRVLADMAATGARIEVVSGKAAGTVLIVEPELMLGRQADPPGDPAGRMRKETPHELDGDAALEVPQEVLVYLQQQQTLTLATASPTGVPARPRSCTSTTARRSTSGAGPHRDRPADRSEPGRRVHDR